MNMKAGIPWYRKEQWSRWKEININTDSMCGSFDDWLNSAEGMVKKLTKDGLEVHKIDVEVEEFLVWAAKQNLPITGFARAEFANFKLGSEQMRRLNRSEEPLPSREEVKRFVEKAKGLDFSELWEPYLRRPKAAVCPIFRDMGAGLEQIGSGILLQIEDVHFLLTAAHVTDERRSSDLFVPAKTGFVNLFGLFIESSLPSSGSRIDDKSDVSVVRLSQDLVARLHDDLLFLEYGDVDLAEVTSEKDAYTIIGYPARRSVKRDTSVYTDQFSLSGEGVVDGRLAKLGLKATRHVMIQYRMRRGIHYSTMLRTQAPHPEGMSGGGIFAWNKALPKLSALEQPKLVGILTEYHQHLNVFVGTRLSAHIMAIHRNDPSLPIVPH